MSYFSVKVSVDYFRVYCGDFPEIIGKWVIACLDMGSIYGRMTKMAVTDDFGNLVGVPS